MTFNGESYNDRFMADLVNFVAGDRFQTMFESFFLTYAMEFTHEEEHKLRYYELYQMFHDMFERQLEIFCSETGISQTEFMKRSREITAEDKKAKHYMDILLSSVEYDTFVKLMRMMRPVAQQRIAEAADAKGTPAEAKGSERASPAKAAAKEEIGSSYVSPARAEGKPTAYDDDEVKTEKVSSK